MVFSSWSGDVTFRVSNMISGSLSLIYQVDKWGTYHYFTRLYQHVTVLVQKTFQGKHKNVALKNFDFLFWFRLFWVVNLVQSFKGPRSNNFLFWQYCPFVPEPKSTTSYDEQFVLSAIWCKFFLLTTVPSRPVTVSSPQLSLSVYR